MLTSDRVKIPTGELEQAQAMKCGKQIATACPGCGGEAAVLALDECFCDRQAGRGYPPADVIFDGVGLDWSCRAGGRKGVDGGLHGARSRGSGAQGRTSASLIELRTVR